MGAAWLARQYWEHYAFTGDRKFLEQDAYPVMKGAAESTLDFLVEDLTWAGGRLGLAAITSALDGPVVLRTQGGGPLITDRHGRGVSVSPVNPNEGVFTFDARAGERYIVRVGS